MVGWWFNCSPVFRMVKMSPNRRHYLRCLIGADVIIRMNSEYSFGFLNKSIIDRDPDLCVVIVFQKHFWPSKKCLSGLLLRLLKHMVFRNTMLKIQCTHWRYIIYWHTQRERERERERERVKLAYEKIPFLIKSFQLEDTLAIPYRKRIATEAYIVTNINHLINCDGGILNIFNPYRIGGNRKR